ncbi:MAG: J domain-containing protein [Deltaproteobacteria bacterium]|nr:J domain-containing protein [Deltaproteobacteria bacterium]
MYLAQKIIKKKLHYIIRESYWNGKYFRSRDLFDLGDNPAKYIIYPGGNAYYIDEKVENRLNSLGVKPGFDELDNIFWRFLKPEIKYILEMFSQRSGRTQRKKGEGNAQFHLFDKRRIHFLRFGNMDQGKIGRISPKLFQVLLNKSRDEIEQYFLESEGILDPSEFKPYVYVIFDLQRFSSKLTAKTMPQALNQKKVDEYFIEEICRLNKDRSFWAGMTTRPDLNEYLIRYIIMFFDNEYGQSYFLHDYIKNLIDGKRFYAPPPNKGSVTLDEAITIFGIKKDKLNKMSRRGLTALYRHMAKKYHPDKGGEHDKFIKLTEAYQKLLKSKNAM